MNKLFLILVLLLGGCATVPPSKSPATEVPVLMYHHISSAQQPGPTFIPFNDFVAQVNELQHRGYKTITIDQLTDYMNRKIDLPSKTIAITFDDGWADQLDAVDELNKRDMSATFFIITGMFGREKYLTQDQVVDLSRNPNFQIGAHTHTHFVTHAEHLETEVSTQMLIDESIQSKEILEDLIDRPVRALAWPYGYTTDDAISSVSQNGFTSTLLVTRTAHNTTDDSPLRIKRLTVDGRCNLEAFINMLKTSSIQECK